MLSLYSEASLIYYFCSRVQRKMHFKLINRCFAYKWTCHLSRMLKWQWRYIYFLYFQSLSLSLSHIWDNLVPLALVLPVLFFQWMTTFWYNPANFKIQYLIIIMSLGDGPTTWSYLRFQIFSEHHGLFDCIEVFQISAWKGECSCSLTELYHCIISFNSICILLVLLWH